MVYSKAVIKPLKRPSFLCRLTGAHGELPQAGSLTGRIFFRWNSAVGFAVCGRRKRRGAHRRSGGILAGNGEPTFAVQAHRKTRACDQYSPDKDELSAR